jgi:sarcosine oxidase subunit alpha
MLASAARTYLNHFGVAVGAKVGVYTACDSAWHAAFDLKQAGVSVPAIVDVRSDPDASLVARAKELGIEVLAGQSVLDTSGSLRIKSMKVGRASGGSTRDIAVDALIMSAGWTPSVHMYSQSRGKVVWDEETCSIPARPQCSGLRERRSLQWRRRAW